MTEIEAKALALLNEVWGERGYPPEDELRREDLPTHEALYRAIEQHEAFKQEVSDAVEAYLNPNNRIYSHSLNRFIIPKPKPDPLVDILLDMELSSDQEQGQHDAKYLRAKLEARGLEIREKGQ
jgi:hypothetical protein